MHHHALKNYHRSYTLGVLLNILFVGVGVWYGLQAHSLALISDAVHNASDVAGLLIAWCGTWIVSGATGQDQARRTSAAALLSLLNALILIVVSGGIMWESIVRLTHPEAVRSTTVLLIALIGVGINGYAAYLFMHGRHHDTNMRGAFLHMAGDALFSCSVVVSALVIGVTGWNWVDPALGIGISAALIVGGVALARDSWRSL